LCVCVVVCARAHLCVCAGLCVFCRSFGKASSPCLCLLCACVSVWHDFLCMPRGCAGAVVARRGPAVFIARPAAPGGRACAVAIQCDRPVFAPFRPQVRRGRAARPARNGLRDLSTRPWSTPPAPSTSSAAKAAAPTTTTCGRAPTEVRGPDSRRGGGRGVHWVGTTRVLRGYSGVERGCCGGTTGC
jgi:hypothetical protein